MYPLLLFSFFVEWIGDFLVNTTQQYFSRKHEYEADDFAKNAQGTPEYLIKSLHKLSEKNLSNLTPHNAYSGFYYHTPTLLERQEHLLK